ncbi:MAG: diadenylate cyclase [Planctomycetales bacterium]|nr:diadenylate cyclase [Planctomycetales bacterium]
MRAPMAKVTGQFATFLGMATQLAEVTEADAILVWVEAPADWDKLKTRAGELTLIVASDDVENVRGAVDAGLDVVLLNETDTPVHERLGHVLLQCVADELLSAGAGVIAVYNMYQPTKIDSVSFIRLDEHLGRLTIRDLRNLETRVPLETLKHVVDLAIEIGREGREGKPVGTMFIVGDSKKVLSDAHPTGFDPVRGYNRKERNIHDSRVREGIKEVAQLDGAFIIGSDGTIEAACQLIEISAANITLSKGLGTRHWAAAAISKKTNALAVTVSESSGTVRVFQNGEVVLAIEPFRRAMKWKDFGTEVPLASPPTLPAAE